MANKNATLVITGLSIKQCLTTAGKNEEDPGKFKIVLEASKEELAILGMSHLTVGDFVSAISVMQSTGETAGLAVRFSLPEDTELPAGVKFDRFS